MPLQKLSGVDIFVSLQECGFSAEHNLTQVNQLCRIRFAFHFVERNHELEISMK